MADTYKLRIVATGENGEEMTTSAEIEAKTPEQAIEQFQENTAGVSYWDLSIELSDPDGA